jgi:hypothetical protein
MPFDANAQSSFYTLKVGPPHNPPRRLDCGFASEAWGPDADRHAKSLNIILIAGRVRSSSRDILKNIHRNSKGLMNYYNSSQIHFPRKLEPV